MRPALSISALLFRVESIELLLYSVRYLSIRWSPGVFSFANGKNTSLSLLIWVIASRTLAIWFPDSQQAALKLEAAAF
jgi:hypothetical protein